MTSMVKVGIIGYGAIGKLHRRALEGVHGVELAAVADPDPACLEGLEPGVRRFTSGQDLLLTDIDAVIICSPTAFHAPASLDALACGKHVLVEKPMAVSVDEARAMCSVARQKERVLLVGMTHRFYPEFREAKRIVDDGTIGDILMCHDTIIEPLEFLGLPSWYLDKNLAGGGVAMSDGIHLIDRVRWFAGDEVQRVAGSTANKFLSSSVEDSAQMFLWFGRNITAQLTMAFINVPHPLVCDLRVMGTKGSILVHTWQGYTLHEPSGTRHKTFYRNEPHEYKVEAGLKAEIEEFCSAIRENRSPCPSPEDSLRALEIVQAFYVAAQTGTIVSLA
jgi:predicted dehydrogenase